MICLSLVVSNSNIFAYDGTAKDGNGNTFYYNNVSDGIELTYGFDGYNLQANLIIPGTLDGKTVVGIGERAFINCSKIESVSFPSTVKSLGYLSFANCTSLASISITANIELIGAGAFSGCTQLEKFTVEGGNTRFLAQDGVLYSKDMETLVSCPGAMAGSFIIPGGVKETAEYAFYGCRKLTSVTLPENFEKVGSYTFWSCHSLKEVRSLNVTPPATNKINAFYENTNVDILYVPVESLNKYKDNSSWTNNVAAILPIPIPCESPEINYSNGCLTFSCQTPGAEIHYEINVPDMKSGVAKNGQGLELSAVYEISAHATAPDYEDSESKTAYLYWLPAGDKSSSNICDIEQRPILVTCNNGYISISGLEENERVDFYLLDGTYLSYSFAKEGTVTYTHAKRELLIIKIGNKSLKLMAR